MTPVLAALLGVVAGAVFGALAASVVAAKRAATFRERLAGVEATLTAERRSASEKLRLLADAEAKLKESFEALSATALRQSSQQFLELATTKLGEFQTGAAKDLTARQTAIDELIKPVRETLATMDRKLGEVDKAREATKATLEQLIGGVRQDQERLASETANLVKALRAPQVRGRWGEIQLRRVVELAGMVSYCDFEEQVSATTESGRLRPDMIVRLPGAKTIVVDSKAPLAAYLESLEAPDEAARKLRLVEHARAVREHVVKLSAKAYWDQFSPSPDFVVLFLPGDTFFSAALESEPALIEFAIDKKVLIATPTSLISLLRVIAYGWRQESLAEEAQEIAGMGRELFDRLAVMGEHFARIGASLDKAVESYDDAVASLEKRVLPSMRRLKESAAATSPKELPEIPLAKNKTTPPTADELTSPQLALPPVEKVG